MFVLCRSRFMDVFSKNKGAFRLNMFYEVPQMAAEAGTNTSLFIFLSFGLYLENYKAYPLTKMKQNNTFSQWRN